MKSLKDMTLECLIDKLPEECLQELVSKYQTDSIKDATWIWYPSCNEHPVDLRMIPCSFCDVYCYLCRKCYHCGSIACHYCSVECSTCDEILCVLCRKNGKEGYRCPVGDEILCTECSVFQPRYFSFCETHKIAWAKCHCIDRKHVTVKMTLCPVCKTTHS